jgi:hypothetical protein
MKIQDIRRARLAQLIETHYGSQAAFIEATDQNQGEISSLLKNKSFGEKKARSIEDKCGLTSGWLDQPLPQEIGNFTDAPQAIPLIAKQKIARFELDDDIQLLIAFRKVNASRKKMILDFAKSFVRREEITTLPDSQSVGGDSDLNNT